MSDITVAVAEAALDRAILNAAKAQARADKASALGTGDDYENGAVVVWERTFDNGVTYTYAAVNSHGVWYLTGRDVNPLSWSSLVERHLVHADNVWLVTAMEALA